MSTISSIASAGSAWPDLGRTRASARADRMFAKADANGDGTVDKTELQTLLDKVASKTGTSPASADDLMSKMDTDGSGSLSKDELQVGMKSLMPPASTVEFAQQHAAGGTASGSDAATATASGNAAATDAAATDKVEGHHPHHGHRPPPADGDGDGDGSSSTTAATGTNPLDTNKDGVVSATEAAAGQFRALITNLSSTLDGSGTSPLTAAQGDAFKSQFDSMIAAMESTGSSGTAAGSTSTSGGSSSTPDQASGSDLSALAQTMMKQYAQAAADNTSGASVSVAA